MKREASRTPPELSPAKERGRSEKTDQPKSKELTSTKRGVVSTASSSVAAPMNPILSLLRKSVPPEVSLHWLTATTRKVTLTDAVAFISDRLGHGPRVHQRGLMGYTVTFEWAGGLKLLVNEKRPEMGLCLLADGNACEFYGLSILAYIYQALQFRATRIDLAVDGCRFTPSALRKLWLKGWVKTQARPEKGAKSGREKLRKYKWDDSPTGDTFYMGSARSTQFARCYNRRGFTRFEMVLKQERAAQVMQALCDGEQLAPTLGSIISQFVAFVALDDKNRSRCTPLPFWAQFIESLTTNGVVTRLEPRPEPTIERLIEWIENQVAPSLVVYESVKGKRDDYDDVRRELRRIGLEHARSKHHALIAAGGGWLCEHDAPRHKLVRDEPLSMLELNDRIEKDAA